MTQENAFPFPHCTLFAVLCPLCAANGPWDTRSKRTKAYFMAHLQQACRERAREGARMSSSWRAREAVGVRFKRRQEWWWCCCCRWWVASQSLAPFSVRFALRGLGDRCERSLFLLSLRACRPIGSLSTLFNMQNHFRSIPMRLSLNICGKGCPAWEGIEAAKSAWNVLRSERCAPESSQFNHHQHYHHHQYRDNHVFDDEDELPSPRGNPGPQREHILITVWFFMSL